MLAQLYAGHRAEPALEVEVELVSFRGVMTWVTLKLILKLILKLVLHVRQHHTVVVALRWYR